MTLPTSTLRDLFEERTTTVPERPGRDREVAARVSRLRRQRSGTAVTAAVLVVAVAVGVPLSLTRGTQARRGVPAWEQTVDGLKVWTNGSKLTAHGSFLSSDRRSMTLRFTPTSWSMGFSTACSRDLGSRVAVFVSVNTHSKVGGGCGPEGATFATFGTYGHEAQAWRGLGVRLGHPVTIRLWLAPWPLARSAAAGLGHPRTYTGGMPATRVTLGVYRRVDPATYPLPRRPETLAPDDRSAPCCGTVIETVDSRTRPAEVNTPRTLHRRLPAGGLTYALSFTTPGQVLVAIDGTTVGRYESWFYGNSLAGGISITPADVGEYGLHLRTGDDITITLTPSRFTDPGWRFSLQQKDAQQP